MTTVRERYIADLENVTHCFGAATALDRVSVTIAPGEVVALLGPNGAGKTTLARILLGLVRPTSGRARLYGRDPQAVESRRRVGAMLQVGKVPETLTVREHVHLFSSYYGTPVPVADTLAAAGVSDFADSHFGRLSGGQRQRALFAVAVCGNPDLLVLDEPTVGLDVEARRAFWSAVRGMTDRGCAVLLTTHYLEEADAVASRIVILHKGRVIRDAAPGVIKRQIGGRRIRCVTSLPIGSLPAIYGVRSVARDGDAVVLLADPAEHVVRELLARDPHLTDLEVSGAGLEEAFVTLTAADASAAALLPVNGGLHAEAARA
jgi:ABC-2 type transport system ATP-binding protein